MTRKVSPLVASAISAAAVLGLLVVLPASADTFDSAEPSILIASQGSFAQETAIEVTRILIYEDSGIVFAHVRSAALTNPTLASSALATFPYGGPMTSASEFGRTASADLDAYTYSDETPIPHGGLMTSDRSLASQFVSWPDARSVTIAFDDSFGSQIT